MSSDKERQAVCSRICKMLREERIKRDLFDDISWLRKTGLSQQAISYVEREMRIPNLIHCCESQMPSESRWVMSYQPGRQGNTQVGEIMGVCEQICELTILPGLIRTGTTVPITAQQAIGNFSRDAGCGIRHCFHRAVARDTRQALPVRRRQRVRVLHGVGVPRIRLE